MEQKKFDINSLIGFILLGAIGMYWIYTNQPTPEELEKANVNFCPKYLIPLFSAINFMLKTVGIFYL